MKGIVEILALALCLSVVFCQTDIPSEEDLACFVSAGVNNSVEIFTNCPDVDLLALQGGNVS